MTDKTVEILIFLLGYLKENNFDIEALNEFSENLIMSGYNANDITEALSIIVEKHNFESVRLVKFNEQKDTSIRVLNDFERMKIPSKVYGYIVKLKTISIISGEQMERVIDYCMLVDSQKITESDIDEIVANVIFEEHLH